MTIREFIRDHYRHFNAATLAEAAQAYAGHLDGGGKMLVAMAGAMSTAELGRSLAEMIRRDKVHAICCTGANLEEDIFNYITQESIGRAIAEEQAKGRQEAPVEPDKDPAKDGKEAKRLEQEVLDLKITNQAKDQYIKHLEGNQKRIVDQLVEASRQIGVLETELRVLEAPKSGVEKGESVDE